MKHTKTLRYGMIAMLTFAFMLIGVAGTKMTTEAADPKLPTGKYVNLEHNEEYSLTLTKDCYLEINLKSIQNDWSYADLYFYKKNGKKYEYVDDAYFNGADTKYIALKKGTYKVKNYYCKKVKISVKTPELKANYCKSKAITLKKGSKVAVVQNRENGYNRWYKVKLTKKQVLKYVSLTGYNYNIRVYDSKLESISMIQDGKTYFSSKRLSKGTYYIVITDDIRNSEHGSVYGFTLK